MAKLWWHSDLSTYATVVTVVRVVTVVTVVREFFCHYFIYLFFRKICDKTQIVTKPKNLNCDRTQKHKL